MTAPHHTSGRDAVVSLRPVTAQTVRAVCGLRVAPEPSGAHVLPLGDNKVLLAASAPRTAEQLAAEGYDVATVDISEFEAVEGCVTCLSVLI
jgi:dimethylargininase